MQKQKSNFHTLCVLLFQKFNITEQAEKRANEVIQLGINQFQTENQNIILDLRLKNYLMEEIINLIIDKLNKEQIESFEDLRIYVYTKDFEKILKDVLSFIGKEQAEPLATTVGNAEIKSDKPKTRSEAQKRADKKYQSSAKGRASYNKYIHSVKGTESLEKYRKSEKGKLTIGRAVKKYQKTVNGYEAIKRAVKKYSQTERGKELRREAVRRFRERQKQKQNTEVIKNTEEEYLKKLSGI